MRVSESLVLREIVEFLLSLQMITLIGQTDDGIESPSPSRCTTRGLSRR